jgi:hypothetical protein
MIMRTDLKKLHHDQADNPRGRAPAGSSPDMDDLLGALAG